MIAIVADDVRGDWEQLFQEREKLANALDEQVDENRRVGSRWMKIDALRSISGTPSMVDRGKKRHGTGFFVSSLGRVTG